MLWEERLFLRNLGEELLAHVVVESSITMLCVGMFTPLYAIVIYTLIKRKEKSLHSKAGLTIISFSLLTSLGYSASELVVQVWAFNFNCHFDPGPSCALDGADIMKYVITSLAAFPFISNDALIIWRAWCIFGKRRWASAISIGLCILCFLVAIVYIYFIAPITWSSVISVSIKSESAVAPLNFVLFSLSLLTNAVATSFIGWTFWKHLKFLGNNGISKQKLFGVWRILALLLDSGVIYGVLQTVMLGLQFSMTREMAENYGYVVFASLYRNLSYAYPSLTILLVQEASSIEEFHNSMVTLQSSQDHSIA